MKAGTLARRERMVAAWNTGSQTLAQIGAAFGMPRGSVGRVLSEARRDGMTLLAVSGVERGRRASASLRAKLGDAGWAARMAVLRAGRGGRGGRWGITKWDNALGRLLYEQGLSHAEIAHRVGSHRSAIHRFAAAHWPERDEPLTKRRGEGTLERLGADPR